MKKSDLSRTAHVFKKTAYKIFGKYVRDCKTENMNKIMRQSRLNMNKAMYVSCYMLILLAVLCLWTLHSFLIFAYFAVAYQNLDYRFFFEELVEAEVWTFSFWVLASTFMTAAYWIYPYAIIKERENRINKNMSVFLHNMYIFSSAGMDINKIIIFVRDTDIDKEIKNEIRAICNETYIFGKDVCTAIETVRKTMCSKRLSSFFEGVENIHITGGDLSAYIKKEKEDEMNSIKIKNAQTDKKMDLFCEAFILLFMAGPLFFLLMALTLSAFEGVHEQIMKILIYRIMPIDGILCAVMLYLYIDNEDI